MMANHIERTFSNTCGCRQAGHTGGGRFALKEFGDVPNGTLTVFDEQKLVEINEALERIENKTYGICEECGKRITANRLKIMPFARLCVPCKSEIEKQFGQFSKAEDEPSYRDLSNIDMEEAEE